MLAVYRKELIDYLTGVRFLILLLLALLTSAAAIYFANQGLRGANIPTEFVFLGLFTSPASPSLFNFINLVALFVIPIVGISLGFDAINKERSGGTLSRIISQPVYRDSVINGKFLAGICILFITMTVTILLVSGYGLGFRLVSSWLGIPTPIAVPPPGAEEIIRLFIYLVFAVIYGAFWMGLSMLFSVSTRSTAISLLSSVALWLFFSVFYVLMIVPAVANAVASTADGSTEAIIRNLELEQTMLRFSPGSLFSEASQVMLQPPAYGSFVLAELGAPGNPLSLGQSMILVWPHLTGLVALTAICFAVSYVLFMRQEVRAT